MSKGKYARQSGMGVTIILARPAGKNVLPYRMHLRGSKECAMAESAYETALRQFDNAVRHLDLPPGIADYLRVPKREITVNFPVEMEDKSVRVFTGYRVHHNTALGPTKG